MRRVLWGRIFSCKNEGDHESTHSANSCHDPEDGEEIEVVDQGRQGSSSRSHGDWKGQSRTSSIFVWYQSNEKGSKEHANHVESVVESDQIRPFTNKTILLDERRPDDAGIKHKLISGTSVWTDSGVVWRIHLGQEGFTSRLWQRGCCWRIPIHPATFYLLNIFLPIHGSNGSHDNFAEILIITRPVSGRIQRFFVIWSRW